MSAAPADCRGRDEVPRWSRDADEAVLVLRSRLDPASRGELGSWDDRATFTTSAPGRRYLILADARADILAYAS